MFTFCNLQIYFDLRLIKSLGTEKGIYKRQQGSVLNDRIAYKSEGWNCSSQNNLICFVKLAYKEYFRVLCKYAVCLRKTKRFAWFKL
jgi:alpha-amylase/alpha-mannosidase (GH57 family)